jgi:hypothetical protein
VDSRRFPLIFDMLACFRDWEDRLRNIVVSAGKVANAAFTGNEWRFIGQANRELSLSHMEAGGKYFLLNL